MRSYLALLVCLLVLSFGKPASGEDDPIRNGIKLSAAIAEFNATKAQDDKSVNRRSELIQAIADYEVPKAFAFLGTVLREDKSRLVKMNAASALNHLGPKAKSVTPDLIAALKDADAGVRAAAATALGMIGPDAKAAAPDLLTFLKDPKQAADVRASAAAALTSVGAEPKEVTPALKEALKEKDLRLRMACASELYRLDKANAKLAVPILREGLKNKDTQMEAVGRLKPLGSDAKAAIPDLIGLLKEGGVGGYYAPETLKAIPEAEAALLVALKDPDPDLQKAAASALKTAFPEAAKKAGLIK